MLCSPLVVAVACPVMYTLVLAGRRYGITGPRKSSKEMSARKKCNDLQLFQKWQTCVQRSTSHVVARRVSLHAIMQCSIAQHAVCTGKSAIGTLSGASKIMSKVRGGGV